MIRDDRVAVSVNRALAYGPAQEGMIRQEIEALLQKLGLGGSRPLEGLVRPGDTVLLKPNLVLDRVSDPRSTLTNGSVIRVMSDLVLESLNGRGKVVIADVPLQSAEFQAVIRLNGLDKVMAGYLERGAPVELLDLRQEYLRVVNGIHKGLRPLPGDALGYSTVNIGEASELEALREYRSQFAVGDYDRDSTTKYHMSSDRNEYLIPRTVLTADVVINLPKMKTHKKSGITCALKNVVGICGHKSYLPHFREGGPRNGGDEFAINHPVKILQRNAIDRLKTTTPLLYRAARRVGRVVLQLATMGEPSDLRRVMSGSWYGNDTLWRTILDLNKILRYADAHGQMQATPQRRYLCLVDGVFAGEGEGPIEPDTRHDGILMAGFNPVLIDLVVCLVMGIEPADIRQVRGAWGIRRYPLVSGSFEERRKNIEEWIDSATWPLPNLRYRLPSGWEGHVRRLAGESEAAEAGGSRPRDS